MRSSYSSSRMGKPAMSMTRRLAWLLSLLAAASTYPLVMFHFAHNHKDAYYSPSSARREDATHFPPRTSASATTASIIAANYTVPIAAAEEVKVAAKQFEWKCADKCSCLPPRPNRNDTTPTVSYMHQSYKTDNQTLWPKGWDLFRQTWLELHKNNDWTFIFWLDEHNDLLAQCTGFAKLFRGRGPLQKADLSRLLYLHVYGGLYTDSDYMALQSQIPLLEEHPILKDQLVLLQGRKRQAVGLEWGYARKPGHPFFPYCLKNHVSGHTSDIGAVAVTGPEMLETCLRTYIGGSRQTKLLPMKAFKDDIMIVEPRLIAPIDAHDFHSECGQWRSSKNEREFWRDEWATSTCREQLLQNGSYAVTLYTQSWGMVND